MAEDVQALTKALAFIAEFKSPTTSIEKIALPKDIAAALAIVENDENIPVDDDDTSISYFQISFSKSGISDVFIADYSGDNPDPFRIIVAVQDGNVIGTSTEVAS